MWQKVDLLEDAPLHEIIVRKITYKFLKLVLLNRNIFCTYYVYVRGYESFRKLRFKKKLFFLYFSVKKVNF